MGIASMLSLRGLDPLRAVTSSLVTPEVLLMVRAACFAFTVFVFISTLVIQQDGWRFLSYFTNITYMAEMIYFAVASYHTFRLTRTSGYACATLQNDSWLTKAHFIFYSTVFVNHLLVPVIYWSLVFPTVPVQAPFTRFVTIGKHGLDLLLMLVELTLGRMAVPWAALPFALLVVVLYTFWAWTVHAISGVWAYSFLDWDRPAGQVAGWYLLVTGALVVAFIISLYLHRLRDRVLARFAERVEDNERLRRELRYRSSSIAVEMRGQDNTFSAFL